MWGRLEEFWGIARVSRRSRAFDRRHEAKVRRFDGISDSSDIRPKNFNEIARRTRAQRPPGARFAGLSIGLISPAHYSTDATPVGASRVACESDAGSGRGQNTAIGRSSPGRGRRRQSSRRWRTRRRERRRGEPRWAWHRRHARRGSQPSRGRRSGARWPRRSSPA